jgi:hypothetical protein
VERIAIAGGGAIMSYLYRESLEVTTNDIVKCRPTLYYKVAKLTALGFDWEPGN